MRAWRRASGQRAAVHRWLSAPGSLSAHLRASGGVFRVEVVQQGRGAMQAHEMRALGIAGDRAAYVREVLLRVGGEPVVFARSVCPYPASRGAWRAIRGLGARPLADLLFCQASVSRQPLHYGRCQAAHRWWRRIAARWGSPGAHQNPLRRSAPARHSVFVRRGAPLLVLEVFAGQRAPWCWPLRGPR